MLFVRVLRISYIPLLLDGLRYCGSVVAQRSLAGCRRCRRSTRSSYHHRRLSLTPQLDRLLIHMLTSGRIEPLAIRQQRPARQMRFEAAAAPSARPDGSGFAVQEVRAGEEEAWRRLPEAREAAPFPSCKISFFDLLIEILHLD